jgi:hypothetical protein
VTDDCLKASGVDTPPFSIPSVVPCTPTGPRECVIAAPGDEPVKT